MVYGVIEVGGIKFVVVIGEKLGKIIKCESYLIMELVEIMKVVI